MNRAKFIVVNTFIVALGYLAYRAGFLNTFWSLGRVELVMLAALVAYAVIGFGCIFAGHVEHARHISNQLAIWGLSFTGTALMLAIGIAVANHDSSRDMLISIAFAIAPNVVATALLAWLRDCAWWSAGAEL